MNKLYSVHDHWTDIDKKNDVDIESIDGVITGIKVNGEDYGGGESGYSTAKLTYEADGQVPVPPIYISRIWDNAITSIIPVIGTYDVVLYNGVAYGILDSDDHVHVDGAIEYDDGDLVITGDCTIIISNIL